MFTANATFYINTIPNLIVVQILWYYHKQKGIPLASFQLWMYLLMAFLVTSTGLAFFGWWLPSIVGLYDPDSSGADGTDLSKDYCLDHH